MQNSLYSLQQDLNYFFSDLGLARKALTHRSADKLNNERLEFLGDSLLGFVIAETLFETYPAASEGELSRMRSSLVNKSALATIARALNLGEYISLGSGEIKSGGKQRDSILADALEALIAAIYLDGGIAPCKQLIRAWSSALSATEESVQTLKDAKTQLQELMQAKGLALPEYLVQKTTGEAHQQTFYVKCHVELLEQAYLGVGGSKRIAEQDAARKVLDELGERE